LYVLNASELPCFEKFKTGTCSATRDKPCMYNHTIKKIAQ
jgi:hypothetical protein